MSHACPKATGGRASLPCFRDRGSLLGGSWDLASKLISTLIGVLSIVTLIITLVTKSHDPLSRVEMGVRASELHRLGLSAWLAGFGACVGVILLSIAAPGGQLRDK